MKTNNLKRSTEKIANMMIVALVVVGTCFFAIVMEAAQGGELMSKLFLAFLGAIITVQVIPGLVLLGAMLKGVFSLGQKQEATAEGNAETRKPE